MWVVPQIKRGLMLFSVLFFILFLTVFYVLLPVVLPSTETDIFTGLLCQCRLKPENLKTYNKLYHFKIFYKTAKLGKKSYFSVVQWLLCSILSREKPACLVKAKTVVKQ